MPEPISFEKIDVNLVSAMDEAGGRPDPEAPFRILVLGDFSGRAGRGICDSSSALSNRRPVAIDRDDLEAMMVRLGVEVRLPILGQTAPAVTIRFSELDDFHPDRLYETLEVFKAFKDARKGLSDLTAFDSVVRRLQKEGTSPIRAPEPPIAELTGEPGGSLLDQILDSTVAQRSGVSKPPPASPWDAYLQDLVSLHMVPRPDQKQAEMIEAVDVATGELMRRILHHPDFQALEAAWRGLDFLVSRLETGANLQIWLWDVSKEELTADLASSDLSSSAFFKHLVTECDGSNGREPWAVIAGNYTFGPSREDAELAGRLTRIARLAGAPFIAAAGDEMLGCRSLGETPDPDDWQLEPDKEGAEAWDALRLLPEAVYLGLVLPRFLLRLPYGEDTDPVEAIDFQEMAVIPAHRDYLWGNPALVCALLLGEAFSRRGWDLQPGCIQDIERLPLHIYPVAGEPTVKPCAEAVLSERAIDLILDQRLMLLLSFRNRDGIRLARFQSFASPASRLAGRWR